MADLLAGTTVNALDTPPTVADSVATGFTFTHTTYAITGETDTVGVAFMACTTGRANLDYSCSLTNSSVDATFMTPVVREGTTVGSGTSFLAASDDNAVVAEPGTASTDVTFGGRRFLLTGLTPGSSYNVRMEHRVAGSTGTLARRAVTVSPAT